VQGNFASHSPTDYSGRNVLQVSRFESSAGRIKLKVANFVGTVFCRHRIYVKDDLSPFSSAVKGVDFAVGGKSVQKDSVVGLSAKTKMLGTKI
jgi:hypothetical protein